MKDPRVLQAMAKAITKHTRERREKISRLESDIEGIDVAVATGEISEALGAEEIEFFEGEIKQARKEISLLIHVASDFSKEMKAIDAED
jgi:hypothetical protein